MINRLGALSVYVETIGVRALALIAQLGMGIMTARALGPDGRGQYFYIVTLGIIASQLAMLGMHASNSYIVARSPQLLSQIATNTLWVICIASLPASMAIIAVDYSIGGYDADFRLLLVPFFCGASLAFICFSNLAIAINQTRLYNVLLSLQSAATLAAGAICWTLSADVSWFLGVSLVAAMASSVVSVFALLSHTTVRWQFDRALFRDGLQIGLRAYWTTLAAYLFSRLGLVMLRAFGGGDPLGHWSIAVQVADAMLVVPGTIGLIVFPRWSRAKDQERWTDFLNTVAVTAGIMLIGCIAIAMIAEPLITIVFGSEFRPAAHLVVALLPGIFFFSLASIMSPFLTTHGVPTFQIVAWFTVCCAYPVLASLLHNAFGAVGVAYTQSILSAGLVTIFAILCVRFKHASATEEPK